MKALSLSLAAALTALATPAFANDPLREAALKLFGRLEPARPTAIQAKDAALFPPSVAAISVGRSHFTFRDRSPQAWLDTFRRYYGPVHKAFATLDAARQAALAADLLHVAHRFNDAADGTLAAPSEYLEIVVRRL